MSIKDRIGIDLNQRMALEPGIDLAIKEKVRFLNICLDPEPELLDPKKPRIFWIKQFRFRVQTDVQEPDLLFDGEIDPWLQRHALVQVDPDPVLDAHAQPPAAVGAVFLPIRWA